MVSFRQPELNKLDSQGMLQALKEVLKYELEGPVYFIVMRGGVLSFPPDETLPHCAARAYRNRGLGAVGVGDYAGVFGHSRLNLITATRVAVLKEYSVTGQVDASIEAYLTRNGFSPGWVKTNKTAAVNPANGAKYLLHLAVAGNCAGVTKTRLLHAVPILKHMLFAEPQGPRESTTVPETAIQQARPSVDTYPGG
jgi:hypothetical protein